MAKKITAVIKIHIPAGKATPAPPIGPSLAQHGLNLSEFCQKFNDLTQDKEGSTIPVKITIYEDRTYDLEIKTPPAAELLKKAAAIEKGSGKPNKTKVAEITKDQLQRIAEQKMPDLNTDDIEQAMKIIAGTAKSMGIEIK